MSSPRLSETSFIVLGLLELCEPATPYDLKQVAKISTSNFWSVPHTQLYTECARLAAAGLLDEEQEQTGRRRRVYRLTDAGRAALDGWRGEPTGELYELRDEATLKLFFGADPGRLAARQVEAHRQRLAHYEELRANAASAELDAAEDGLARGRLLALELGIGHELEFIRYWSELAGS
jgi:DNA-binding PadR family transcriptional regulator